jgi:hypothetical protein
MKAKSKAKASKSKMKASNWDKDDEGRCRGLEGPTQRLADAEGLRLSGLIA